MIKKFRLVVISEEGGRERGKEECDQGGLYRLYSGISNGLYLQK